MTDLRDEFLSEEDLDLRNLSQDELIAYWNLWLEQALNLGTASRSSAGPRRPAGSTPASPRLRPIGPLPAGIP
jgi:hypothetical protein